MRKSELHAMLSGDPADAAPWVELAATHGLPEAQVRWGRMLLEGTGVAKDATKALGWFKAAARSGDADAMNMAGRCHENGWGTAVDTAAAVVWYRKSAEAGHDWGEYNYANMLFDGIGIAADPAQAMLWYLKAAGKGHSRAMNQAARCYEEGWGVTRDHAAAAGWYRQSAETGYFRGQYNYATLLGAEGRIEEAVIWFWKAAETGTLDIRRRIGRDLLGRVEPGFHETGLRVLALCCESGEASDFYHYGRVLLHGFRCEPDEAGGVEWLRRAAEAGHGEAVAELLRAGYSPAGNGHVASGALTRPGNNNQLMGWFSALRR
jgi:TPR repeat protein